MSLLSNIFLNSKNSWEFVNLCLILFLEPSLKCVSNAKKNIDKRIKKIKVKRPKSWTWFLCIFSSLIVSLDHVLFLLKVQWRYKFLNTPMIPSTFIDYQRGCIGRLCGTIIIAWDVNKNIMKIRQSLVETCIICMTKDYDMSTQMSYVFKAFWWYTRVWHIRFVI